MLVLTRLEGQRVLIEGGIVVEVIELGRGRVKLGFTAPHGVAILREELASRPPRREEGGGR